MNRAQSQHAVQYILVQRSTAQSSRSYSSPHVTSPGNCRHTHDTRHYTGAGIAHGKNRTLVTQAWSVLVWSILTCIRGVRQWPSSTKFFFFKPKRGTPTLARRHSSDHRQAHDTSVGAQCAQHADHIKNTN